MSFSNYLFFLPQFYTISFALIEYFAAIMEQYQVPKRECVKVNISVFL